MPKLGTTFGKRRKIRYNIICLIRGIEREPSTARVQLAPRWPQALKRTCLRKAVPGSISYEYALSAENPGSARRNQGQDFMRGILVRVSCSRTRPTTGETTWSYATTFFAPVKSLNLSIFHLQGGSFAVWLAPTPGASRMRRSQRPQGHCVKRPRKIAAGKACLLRGAAR